ncbi:hypothetical protein D3C73_1213980 [compost metagenome]
MGAFLDQTAAVQDQDTVRFTGRGYPLRNDDLRARVFQFAQTALNMLLRLQIDRRGRIVQDQNWTVDGHRPR